MKTIYFFLEPKEGADYLLFLDEFDNIVDTLNQFDVSPISLITLEQPIYLSPMFEDRNNNKHIEPSNYIFVSAPSYSKLLQAKKALKSQYFCFNIFDLTKYDCNPINFTTSFSDDFCESTTFIDFAEFLNNKTPNPHDCNIKFTHIGSFKDTLGNRIEAFEENSNIYYFAKRDNKVYEFFLAESIIRDVCVTDTYITDFYIEHICGNSNYVSMLVDSGKLLCSSYHVDFWEDVIEKLTSKTTSPINS